MEPESVMDRAGQLDLAGRVTTGIGQTIVVFLDASPSGQKRAAYAARLAKHWGSSVVGVQVVAPPEPLPGYMYNARGDVAIAADEPLKPAVGTRGVLAMIIRTCLLSLSSALLVGIAAAQAPPWPIVNGRQLQPTQQQVDSKEDTRARQGDRDVQSQIDRLYDEILRSSSPRRR